jgi:uncharacterized protein involved in exopolysaccharide biosynthesis
MKAQRDVMEAERSSLDELMTQIRAEAAQRAQRLPDAKGDSPYRRLLAFPSLFTSTVTGELLALLAEVENQRTEKLMLVTASDRDVELLTARVDQLEGQLQGIAETYLASLNSQVAAFDGALAGFESELARIPDA